MEVCPPVTPPMTTSKWLFVLDLLLRENVQMGVSLEVSSRWVQRTNHAPSWSILVQRSMSMKDRRISIRIPIYACGSITALIMSMMKPLLKSMFMKILLSRLWSQYWKAIMQPSWLMVKQAQVKLILWRVSNIQLGTLKEVLCLDQWRKYSDLFRCNLLKTPHLWWEPPIYKSIMKLSATCLKSIGLPFRFVKIKRRECLWRDSQNGQSDLLMKFIVWCKKVHWVGLQPQQRWMTCHLDHMQCLL